MCGTVVLAGGLTIEDLPLASMHITLGNADSTANNIGCELEVERGFRKRIAVLAENLLLCGQADDEQCIRVEKAQVADKVDGGPLPHPGHKWLVRIA